MVVVALLVTSARQSEAGAQDTTHVVRRRIPAPEVIGGLTCDATPNAWYYESGRLQSCPLSQDTTIATHRFPRGTWVQLNPEGRLASVWLPRDWAVQGHTCRGTGNRGWSVTFHPNGALAFCYLGAVEEIDGVPCERGTFWGEMRRAISGGSQLGVRFRPDGSLESCQAARDFQIDGRAYKKGDRVSREPL
jgi:hypothetical protein